MRETLAGVRVGRDVVPAVGKRAHDAGGPGIIVEGTASLVWKYMYLVKPLRARASRISLCAGPFRDTASCPALAWGDSLGQRVFVPAIHHSNERTFGR